MSYELATLGQEIRVNRELRGQSQEDLAGILGVDRSSVGAWERNEALPTPKNIAKLIEHKILEFSRARELVAAAFRGYPVGKFCFAISISPPRYLVNQGVKFGLLYIRPGPNDSKLWKRGPINLVHWFEISKGRGQPNMVARVRQRDRKGFQYKCFADFLPLGWKDVSLALTRVGYEVDERPGDGEPGRLYFLLPDEFSIKSPPPENFKNNFFYPE